MSFFWRMATARGLMTTANKKGESGHPCLVPLCRVKGCEISSLLTTVADGVMYSIWNQLINNSPRPNLHIVDMRNIHLTLSKAFSSSSLAIMVCACYCEE